MQYLGKVRDKEIHHTTQVEELAVFPHKNYLALVLADQYQTKIQGALIEHILLQEPLFVYCCCANFQDMEDDVAELLVEKYPDFDDDTVMPMTFAGPNLPEALEFCVFDAFHETQEIEHIVLIDLRATTTNLDEIKKTMEQLGE